MNTNGIRILAFAASFEPRVGGGEKYASRYLSSLVEAGASVDVVTTVDGITGDRELHGIRVHYRQASRFAGFPVFNLSTIHRFAVASQCNVLQTFAPAAHDFLVMAYALARRLPLITVYHADLKNNRGVGFVATQVHNRTVLQASHRIMTTNTANAERLRARGLSAFKLLTIAPGVDSQFFDVGPNREAIDLLFVGALDEYHDYKRLDLLFRALASLNDGTEVVRLTVVGHGNRLEHFRRMAESLGLSQLVSFRGFVDDDELPSLYHSARALVLPSPTTQEGFGLVCFEAMASGTSVVCSRRAGAASIVATFAGCAVWDGDTLPSLVAAIRKARAAPRSERQAMAQSMHKYSWTSMGKTIRNDVFAELVR